MTKAQQCVITAPGDTDQLQWQTLSLAKPANGQVLVRHTAVGLNYIDTYHRAGLYPLDYPSAIGLEAAGVVEAVGAGVSDFKPGDRVAYCSGPLGAYASKRLIDADHLVELPDAISDEIAAAIMLKGFTAAYLLTQTYAVRAGDVILWHAAAGGVGSMAVQWAKALGATVIGTVGSAEKMVLARDYGCDHVIRYDCEDVVERVRQITAGQGVDVVFDSVGADTFWRSLDCLKVCGTMVSFGNASGAAPEISPLVLGQKGSLFLTRPMLLHYSQTRQQRQALAAKLFDVVASGTVKVAINQRFPLSQAHKAQRALETRQTSGCTLLIPGYDS